MTPSVAVCGADEADQATSNLAAIVTCPACQKWLEQNFPAPEAGGFPVGCCDRLLPTQKDAERHEVEHRADIAHAAKVAAEGDRREAGASETDASEEVPF